jgi:pimeloyl-ACP methyl ester carboxylesterase
MKLKVNGKEAYFTTSGRVIVKDQPTIVFVHGSGLTHVTWVLQTRYFAFHGYNTIAVDLPGHGDSEGPPLKSIEESFLCWTFSGLSYWFRICSSPC